MPCSCIWLARDDPDQMILLSLTHAVCWDRRAEKHNCMLLRQAAIPLTATNFDRIDPDKQGNIEIDGVVSFGLYRLNLDEVQSKLHAPHQNTGATQHAA